MNRNSGPFLLAVCFALWIPTAIPAHAAVVAPDVTDRSQNGRFSVDINSTAPNEIIVAMQRHEGEVTFLSWSKKVPWNGANAAITAFPWIRRYVSNDGKTVVLYNQQYRNESWTWVTKDAEPVRHFGYGLRQMLGWEVETGAFRSPFMSESGLLQFLYEEEGVHALWFPTVNKWLTIDLATGGLRRPDSNLAEVLTTLPMNAPKTDVWMKPPSEDLVRKLNAEATRRSLEAVRRHQPSAIKAMLKPVHEKIGALIPSLKPSGQLRSALLPGAYAGYIFLARHKVPEAESYIRKLLELPFESSSTYATFRPNPEFGILSQERLLGDLALRLWNDEKIDASSGPTEPFARSVNARRQKYLGGVAGRVQLPMVRPDTKPGALWVYLIPAEVKPGAWAKSRDIIPLFGQLDLGAAFVAGPGRFGPPQFDAVEYRFETIQPGKYRLKAVWDRRAPLAELGGRALPEPGDYESAESEPFTIAAGSSHSGPLLQCTNRVGQAETYYAADDLWKQKNPTPAPHPYITMRGTGYVQGPGVGAVLWSNLSPPPHGWIVKGDVTAKHIEYKKAEVVQVLPIGALLERDELIVTFAVKDLSDQSLRKLAAEILDEHGCAWEASVFVPTPRAGPGEMTVRAGVFPRKKEFTLNLRSATENKVVCSYKINNGGSSQNANWVSRPLPVSKTLGDRTVRLSGLSRSGGAKFQLLEKGEAIDWNPESIVYQDREGNRSFEADDFCQKERQIKVQIAQESQTREFIVDFSDK